MKVQESRSGRRRMANCVIHENTWTLGSVLNILPDEAELITLTKALPRE
jgi:hypothetical protein